MRPVSFLLAAVLTLFVFAGCGETQAPSDVAETESSGDVDSELAAALIQAKQTAVPTIVLSAYPDMDRGTAYDIQLQAFQAESEGGNYLVGWKLGGTRVVDASVPPDPSFAYMLRSDSLPDGAVVSGSQYVDGDLLVEAEIAFIMGKDLQGASHSMESVADAVAEVAGAIELIDVRIVPGDDGVAPSTNHMIAAKLSHAGVILTEERHALGEVDLVAETATAFVDGEQQATGAGNQIMGTNAMDALHWLANALPEHGLYLRAGDVVITGSLYDNPTLVAGHTALVQFSTLGSISVSMEE